ncbi:phage portal protein [Devosia sp. LjRoot16]|uniref:phage portal protein n=1 Tax=Devosia sp. LjRoot16 TaxID=3342271 RepID=UPI003ECF745F
MKPATRKSLRGRLALSLNGVAMAIGGLAGARNDSGYEAARRSTRRTRNWRAGEGSPAADILPDLGILRGRSRDLERNNPIALGAINTKVNGVVGAGLRLRSVLDAKVLGIAAEDRAEIQYQIEREWDLFCREADFTGLMHFDDQQRLIFHSARVSGDLGIARRYRKRPGETYGTRIVLVEADRISNPNRATDTAEVQGGVKLAADGEVLGCYITDRHPGERSAQPLRWNYMPRRGSSGLLQFILAAEITRPGQVRGVPMFAAVEESLKQLGDYSAAELKAAINDAYLFAFEKLATVVDDDGQPIVMAPEGGVPDEAGELTLEDLAITTLAPGSDVQVKKPERPNTAFNGFFEAFCKQIGVALGIPMEVLLAHFSSSFSAARGALEVAYKGFMVDQAWFIRTVLDPIREWQFTEMVASGRFDAPGFFDDPIKRAAWLGRVWIGPTRIQINPQVEANADKTDIEMNVKSREQVMTERTGGDFDTKSAQILHEREVLGAGEAAAAPQQKDERNNDGTDKDDDSKDEDE